MAQRVIHELIDDLNGGDADETITFAFEGAEYEIDLSTKNADKMRKALDIYIAAARKTGGRRKGGPTGGRKVNNAKVREWAHENGYEVSERGRLPAHVVQAYEATGGR